MIEGFGIALEDVVVSLIDREQILQIVQDSGAAWRVVGHRTEWIAARYVVVRDRGRALEDLHRLLELKLIQIAGDDYIGAGIDREQVVDEVIDRLGLSGALHFAGVERRLITSEQRCAPALRGEVIVDYDVRLAVEVEGRNQRWARVEEWIVGIGLLFAVPVRGGFIGIGDALA